MNTAAAAAAGIAIATGSLPGSPALRSPLAVLASPAATRKVKAAAEKMERARERTHQTVPDRKPPKKRQSDLASWPVANCGGRGLTSKSHSKPFSLPIVFQ